MTHKTIESMAELVEALEAGEPVERLNTSGNWAEHRADVPWAYDVLVRNVNAGRLRVKTSLTEIDMTPFIGSGSKYLREMRHMVDGCADVYAVLIAFDVHCPARQHAIKKLLCPGIRGKGDTLQDLTEARDAIERAIEIEESAGA